MQSYFFTVLSAISWNTKWTELFLESITNDIFEHKCIVSLHSVANCYYVLEHKMYTAVAMACGLPYPGTHKMYTAVAMACGLPYPGTQNVHSCCYDVWLTISWNTKCTQLLLWHVAYHILEHKMYSFSFTAQTTKSWNIKCPKLFLQNKPTMAWSTECTEAFLYKSYFRTQETFPHNMDNYL